MLPTTGFFKNIECPYHESNCDRPYCHFRHRKKISNEALKEPVAVAIPSTSEIPTYNPTPKSQLASNRNSHIPISYVPDLTGLPRERPFRYNSIKPIYKPTPLSVLSSTKDAEETYKPTDVPKYDPGDTSPDVEINFEDLSTEFDLIGELINEGNAELNNLNGIELVVDSAEGSSCENDKQTEVSVRNNSEFQSVKSDTQLTDNNDDTKRKNGCDSNKDQSVKSETSSKKQKSESRSSSKNHEKSSKNKIVLSKQKNREANIQHKRTQDHESDSDDKSTKTKKHSQSKRSEKQLQKDLESKSKSKDPSKRTHKHANSEVDIKSKRRKKSKGKDSASDSELKNDSKRINTEAKKCKRSGSDADRKHKNKKERKEKHSESDSDSKEDAKPINKSVKKLSSKNSESDIELKGRSKKSKAKDTESKDIKQKKHISKSLDAEPELKSNKVKDSESDSEPKAKSLHKDTKSKDNKRHRKSIDESDTELKRSNKKESKSSRRSKSTDSEKKQKSKGSKSKNESSTDDSEGDHKQTKHKKAKHESSSESDSTTKKKKSSSSSKQKDSVTYKAKDSSRHKSSKKSKTTSKSSKSKHKSESRHKSVDKKVESHHPVQEVLNMKKEDDNSDYYSDNMSELSDNVDETMQECYKIFTEYKPTEPQIYIDSTFTPMLLNDVEPTLAKKRVAHDSATQSKLTYTKPKSVPTAAQVMMNRFKSVRYNNEIDEQSEIMAEISKHVLKRPSEPEQPKLVKKPRTVEPKSSSLIDDIINGRTVNAPKRRIAPVLNAGLIQRAKAQIDEMAKAKNAAASKTLVQTVIKGSQRVAHVPEHCTTDIPDLLEIEKSKLPVNVRVRFLKMMVEECVKLYYNMDEAHQRAVNEEFKCYERCAALVTYRNSAMLAVNRLRKERQEREAAGLERIFPGETPNNNKDTQNPLRGRNFYNNVCHLVLSEEELLLHGFPRESSTPGRALLKPLKNTPMFHSLSDNDRVCTRCLKHYQVDDEGCVLHEEECLYHPCKKRTLRGESIYLCCKSTDESGCVTSNTHVSDSTASDCDGYQMTMPAEDKNDIRSYAVYALDCEMCYTTRGLELTRVTIVNSDCKTVYETLVKPLNPIIDYNTRFSGITEDQMERTATSILQVQANILHLCNANTILIGHSLESDMKALKIIHSTIIDTSVLFPHKFGLPHKRALRDLAREYLKKIIQNDISGHDSAEDALTCMELVQWKVREECKSHGIKI